ncbi:MAG TPA: hypothetical protein PKD96_02770 [Candidatus Absconditabacterales bacterium]|nr:hypothetical protein [Candidatus Absconditabacterales bacterium]HMT27201.1 hypothetical protein [Candidatus Absconditabacterales bacterium]
MAELKKKTTTKKTEGAKKIISPKAVKAPVMDYAFDDEMADAFDMEGACCGGACCGDSAGFCGMGKKSRLHIVIIVLLALNTVALAVMLFTTKSVLNSMDAKKVGGIENYKLLEKIYNHTGFREQQKMFIEDSLKKLDQTTMMQQGSVPQETGATVTQ